MASDGISVKDLERGLKGFATENTLKNILQKMGVKNDKIEKLIKEVKDTNTISSEKIRDLHNSMDNLSDGLDDAEDSQKKNTDEVKKSSTSLKSFRTNLLSIIGIVGSFTSYMAGAVNGTLQFGKELDKAGLNLFSSSMKSSMGLTSAADAAIRANLSLSKLSDLAATNAAELNYIGLDNFAIIVDRVQKNLGTVGYTSSEVSNYLTEYLETQRFVGYRMNLTTEEMIKYVGSTGHQMRELSLLLGISREELTKNVKNAMKDPTIGNFISTFETGGERVRQNLEILAASLGRSEVSDLQNKLLESIVDPIAVRPEMFKFLPLLGNQVQDAFFRLREVVRTGTSDEVKSATESFVRGLSNVSAEQQRQLLVMGDAGKEYYNLIHQARLTSKLIDTENDARAKAAKSLNISVEQYNKNLEAAAAIEEAMTSLKNVFSWSLFKGLSDDTSLVGITSGINSISKTITDAAPKIANFLSKFITIGAELVGGWMTKFSNWVDTLDGLEGEKLQEKIGEGIKGLVNDIMGSISESFMSMFSSGEFWKSALAGIGAVSLSGLMVGIAAFGIPVLAMEGLAMGLSTLGAAAGPVTVGVGVLALIITTLGALTVGAISGLGWSLGVFGEGLEKVNESNPSKLLEIASAVSELGKAMVVLAGGKLTESFSSMLSPFSKVMELFGTKSGLDKIISNMEGIDTNKFAATSNALVNVTESVDNYASSLERLLQVTKELSTTSLRVPTASLSPGINTMSGSVTQYSPIKETKEIVEKLEKTTEKREIEKTKEIDFSKINTQLTETNKLLRTMVSQMSDHTERLRELKRALQDR